MSSQELTININIKSIFLRKVQFLYDTSTYGLPIAYHTGTYDLQNRVNIRKVQKTIKN
jgi:hypothetical protein